MPDRTPDGGRHARESVKDLWGPFVLASDCSEHKKGQFIHPLDEGGKSTNQDCRCNLSLP